MRCVTMLKPLPKHCQDCRRVFRAHDSIWHHTTTEELPAVDWPGALPRISTTTSLLCQKCVRARELPTWPARLKALEAAYATEMADGYSFARKPNPDVLRQLYTKRTCVQCARPFYSQWPKDRDCTGTCRRAAWAHEAYLRQKAARGARRAPRPCEHCGETYAPTRAHAQYCSVRCRMRAFRGSEKGRGVPAEAERHQPIAE